MKKILSLCAFMVLTTQAALATELPEGYKTSFLLPIDWSQAKHRDLSVNIPMGYKSLQPTSTWDKAPLIEFIPKDEHANAWSEILTIQKLIGKRISADQITTLLMQNISQVAKTSVLFKSAPLEKDQKSVFIIKYTHNGKEEVMGAEYLSGPYDCAGVQYTIRLSKKISEQEAVKKIKTFFDENLAVIEN